MRGRVSLTGDAAFCVSLLAGQSTALAMVSAYILAGELHRADGDYARAFAKYQELLHLLFGKSKTQHCGSVHSLGRRRSARCSFAIR